MPDPQEARSAARDRDDLRVQTTSEAGPLPDNKEGRHEGRPGSPGSPGASTPGGEQRQFVADGDAGSGVSASRSRTSDAAKDRRRRIWPWSAIDRLMVELRGTRLACSAADKRANRLAARIQKLDGAIARHRAQERHDQGYIDALESRLEPACVEAARKEKA